MSPTFAQSIAAALRAESISLCTHVPGYGGTEAFQAYAELLQKQLSFSFHEEVAFTLAHGAALSGHRAACLIKTHGLAKAANSVLSSLSCGTNAGLVVFVFDDVEGKHSDNIFDAEALVQGLGVPYRRLNPETPAADIRAAFQRSEQLGLPFLLLADTRDTNTEVKEAALPPQAWRPIPFQSRPHFNTVCPPLAGFQKRVLNHKLEGQTDWREWPAPPTPFIPNDLPPKLRDAAQKYVPTFEAFREVVRQKPSFVAGDAGTSGLFAFAPFHCIDLETYMGGSTALAAGALLAGQPTPWAVTGDFSFIAAGTLGLKEAAFRGLPLKLLIFNNQSAAATGGQPVPPRALELSLAPYTAAVRRGPGNQPSLIRELIEKAHAADSLRIVVVDT